MIPSDVPAAPCELLRGATPRAVTAVGAGAPVVLAHGAGGGVQANFAAVIETLAPTHRLVGVDYPGSGHASPADALTLADLADRLVAAAVDDGHECFAMVGISLGSAVALTAADRHPEQVSALVLDVGFARADASVRRFAALYGELVAAEAWTALAHVLDLLSTSASHLGGLDVVTTEAQLATTAEAFEQEALRAAAPQLRLAAQVDVVAAARRVAVPTQVHVAGQDRIVLPATTRELADLIPGAELVEHPEAGHIRTVEEDRAWSEQIARFLRREAG